MSSHSSACTSRLSAALLSFGLMIGGAGAAQLAQAESQDAPAAEPAAAAAEEDSWALITEADRLRSGDAAAQDLAGAKELYEQAIEMGNAAGYLGLGSIYATEGSEFYDLDQAVDAYERAAAEDQSWAMIALADLYRAGTGVPEDLARAKELYEEALADGNAGASPGLGAIYRTESSEFYDPEEAAEILQQGAADGEAWAMIALADMLRAGDGVPADPARAKELYEQAVSAGNPAGNLGLGQIYAEPGSEFHDPAKAAEFYAAATEAGDTWGMILSGDAQRTGTGVPVDLRNAEAQYEAAAAAGNYAALDDLLLLYTDGLDREGLEKARAVIAEARGNVSDEEIAAAFSGLSLNAQVGLAQVLWRELGIYDGPVNARATSATIDSMGTYCRRASIDCTLGIMVPALAERLAADL